MAQPVMTADQSEEYIVPLVIADGVAIDVGDLITYEGSTAIQMAAANKDDYLAGVSVAKKVASDGQTVLLIHRKPIIWIDATSATYTIGDEVKWTSANAVVASGAATGIGRIIGLPNGGTSETATRVKIILYTYKFWETGSA